MEEWESKELDYYEKPKSTQLKRRVVFTIGDFSPDCSYIRV